MWRATAGKKPRAGLRCAEPGRARLLRRWRRARIGRIPSVKSAGAPLADGVGLGWAAQPFAAWPGQRRWLRAGKGEPAGRATLPFAVLSLQEPGVWAGLCLSPGFLHDSPHLRLLIPSFHREGAVPRRNETAKGALLACIATSFGGALHERLIFEHTGPIGFGCTTALSLEDSLQGG